MGEVLVGFLFESFRD